MNFNTLEHPPKIESLKETLSKQADIFLGEEKGMISREVFEKIIDDSEKELNASGSNTENGKDIEYDKYKNKFQIGKDTYASMGDIVSARRWGINIELQERERESGQEKKLRKLIKEKRSESILHKHLNKELAERLSESTKHQDMLKSKAYEEIAKRTGIESKQLGVVAEQIVIGVLEGISIDRDDLGFSVIEANAYQDVNDKIDFIIASKHKKRGVGVNEKENLFEEKSIGIQFTTNTSKGEHKADQIAKSKERGIEVDDIVYVEVDKKLLQNAISKWEHEGRSITGPWKFLSPEIRKQILTNLLGELLTDEQIKSLIKTEI